MPEGAGAARSARRLAARCSPVLVLIAGLVVGFHATLSSGFLRHQESATDCLHTNYVLEWGYRCLSGDALCGSFWDPPLYHPAPGVAALNETLLGLQPFYAPWRAAGLPPIWAQYACAASLLALDFLLAYWLFRRFLRTERAAALLGSWIFAFGAPRLVHFAHIQCFAQAPLLFALAGLLAELSRAEGERGARWGIPALFAGLALQLYSNAYFFWFALLVAAVAFPLTAASRPLRARWARSLRERWLAWAAAAIAAGAAVAPLLARYLTLSQGPLGASWSEVERLLPRIVSWIAPPSDSLLYGPISRNYLLASLAQPWEHRLGVGPVTMAVAIVGVWRLRREAWARALFGALALAGLAATLWPGGFTAWRWVFEYLPGATAVRAVGRLSLIGLLGIALGVAVGWFHLRARAGVTIAALLALLVVAEQVRLYANRHPVRSWQERPFAVAQAIPPDCSSFYLSSLGPDLSQNETHDLAMWASLVSGVPTINGWSSYPPAGWRLWESDASDPSRREATRAALRDWIGRWGLDGARSCWLRVAFADVRSRQLEIERPALAGPAPDRSRSAAERSRQDSVGEPVEPDDRGDPDDR